MLKTAAGLSIIIVFYFGTYKFIKNYFRVNDHFIPMFINLLIMLVLYIAGLIGVLEPAVWVIAFLGVFYFFICVIRIKEVLLADAEQISAEQVITKIVVFLSENLSWLAFPAMVYCMCYGKV